MLTCTRCGTTARGRATLWSWRQTFNGTNYEGVCPGCLILVVDPDAKIEIYVSTWGVNGARKVND